ncbi:polyketide cyclase [Novosphingobium sp. PC22D]|nr:polyketide cyclase [Novosphingobium sp. PC22D]
MASPALASVHQVSDRGFVIRNVAEVPVSPDEAWDLLVRPSQWWDSAHTFSADAANLTLDERAGGCWCEVLRNPDSPNAAPRGSVEHMRVIYIERGRALRLSGGLGPLQADAVVATLTIQFKPGEAGTQVLMEYVVGGYMRREPGVVAPAVDAVLAAQLSRFADKLGGRVIPIPAKEAVGASEPDAEAETLDMPEEELPSGDAAPKIMPIDPDEKAFVPEPIQGR